MFNGVEVSWTPLMAACHAGHERVVLRLLHNGADVAACTETGFTCLMAACIEGRTEAACALMTHGADVNRADKLGTAHLRHSDKIVLS